MEKSLNQEIVQKIKKKDGFYENMLSVQKKYEEYKQLAFYTEQTQTSKSMVLSIKKDDEDKWMNKKYQRQNIEFIIGVKQPNGSKSIQSLLLGIISLIPKPCDAYSIVYINALSANNAYNDFKKILHFLPIQYFSHLNKIYVLNASLKAKAFDLLSFDYLTYFINKKTTHFSSLEQLSSFIGFNEKIINMLPKEIAAHLAFSSKPTNLQIKVQTAKFSAINSPGKIKARYIDQQEVGLTGAPLIIELLIYYFNDKQECLATEGLFRKSANIEEESILLIELQNQNYDYLETITDPHLVANAIKRFLTSLAEPIISYKEFARLMSSPEPQLCSTLTAILQSHSNNKRITIILLFEFFRQKLFPRELDNKMNEENMSTVIGPCLMRSQIFSPKDLLFAPKIVKITHMMFTNFQAIFGGKKQRWKCIRESVSQQEKENLKPRLGSLEIQSRISVQQEWSWCQYILTKEEEDNLDEADQFLSAFSKK